MNADERPPNRQRDPPVLLPAQPSEMTHGHNRRYSTGRSPTYISYWSMRSRVQCKSNASYENYGGRGIGICASWLMPGQNGFLNFLTDMGERPEGMTLDRRDPDGDYTPENCRWATTKEQRANQRRKKLTEPFL